MAHATIEVIAGLVGSFHFTNHRLPTKINLSAADETALTTARYPDITQEAEDRLLANGVRVGLTTIFGIPVAFDQPTTSVE